MGPLSLPPGLLQLLAVAVLVFLSSSRPSQAFIFHLSSGRVTCFAEELLTGAMSVSHFRVADEPPSGCNISASVMDPNGENLHRADSVESGEFGFVAENSGKYTTCFWSPHFQPQVTVTVDFEWRTGIAAKNWASVARKGKIDEIELELRKLEDSIRSIHEEMVYLRDREAESWSLNQTTTSRMGFLSILSFIVCIGVAGLQLWHLKNFFERKKIL